MGGETVIQIPHSESGIKKVQRAPRKKNAASSDTDNERKMLVRDRLECSVLSYVQF